MKRRTITLSAVNGMYYLDALQAGPFYDTADQAILRGAQAKSKLIKDNDSPKAFVPVLWPFQPLDKADKLNIRTNFVLDVAAITTQDPRPYFAEARATPKQVSSVSWYSDLSGTLDTTDPKLPWSPVIGTGNTPPDSWKAISDPTREEVTAKKAEQVVNSATWTSKND